ncbi:uncharacterized protein LOC132050727 [Lycium ferocissimum]|uniref:uncharacterized protein LOC132050727 n=1 Tax=Lycium ferocissimum TaxID=112874 RepID=UPI0028160D5F|nr:uncharacterized protein LOC132050727 [Lycium ferocissimum]
MYNAGNKPLPTQNLNTEQNINEVEPKNRRITQFLRTAFADACSDLPPPSDGALNHFSHRHPLLRLHFRAKEGIRCNFCDILISGLGYGCDNCDYYLHDVCSNFPREIRHDFHPGYNHSLILRPFKAARPEQFLCRACGLEDSKDHSLFQSYYCCESCNFSIHVECASIPITLNKKVKYPLHLFVSFPITSEAATLFCSICTEEVPTSGFWVFYNHDHDYLCHFDCAAVTEYARESGSMGKLQIRLQTLATTNRPPMLAGQPNAVFTHFSHRHALKEYKSDKAINCSMCGIEFSTGYFCSGCNYFIDKICFSIPSMIQHVSHLQHPLKLTCYLDFQNENINCPGCDADFKYYGRAYYCTQCKFIINRHCASAPRTLTLGDNVSYELFDSFPFKHEKAKIKCNICSKNVVPKGKMLYYSLERDEALHVVCAIGKESGNNEANHDRLSIQRLNEVRIAE